MSPIPILARLRGYRTYITAGVTAVVAILYHLGLVDPDLASTLFALLGATGLTFLRAGIERNKSLPATGAQVKGQPER